jgi:ubiquinone/menaquinone biosynthesis C-methylase UbiE
MEPVSYRGPLAQGYTRARVLPAASLTAWMRAAARYVPSFPAPIIDLGAGSGRFSRALADHFAVPVVAIEPSGEMRQHWDAVAPPVDLVGGRGVGIPCADRAVKAVWASQVIHHVIDMNACARELRRVLQPGGRILVRGGFCNSHREPALHRYFPALHRQEAEGASLRAMRVALAQVGLYQQAHDEVEQVSANSLREFYEQTLLRARSNLLRLTDDEFTEGLRRMRTAVENGEDDGPLVDHVDLVIFGDENSPAP